MRARALRPSLGLSRNKQDTAQTAALAGVSHAEYEAGEGFTAHRRVTGDGRGGSGTRDGTAPSPESVVARPEPSNKVRPRCFFRTGRK